MSGVLRRAVVLTVGLLLGSVAVPAGLGITATTASAATAVTVVAEADSYTVRNCEISGIPGAGVEFLAASRNIVTGCDIKKVGGPGIYAHQSSATAPQPNKKSSNNIISGNTIKDAGRDGVYISNGESNRQQHDH